MSDSKTKSKARYVEARKEWLSMGAANERAAVLAEVKRRQKSLTGISEKHDWAASALQLLAEWLEGR